MNSNRIKLSAGVVALTVCCLSTLAEQQTYTLKYPGSDPLARNYFTVGGGAYSGTMYTPGDDVRFAITTTQDARDNYLVVVTNAHTTFGALTTTNINTTLVFMDWRTGAGTINLADTSGFAGLFQFVRPDVVNFTEPTVVNRLRATGRARLQVNGEDRVVVSNLLGRGVLKKDSGTGELELVRTSGDFAGLHFGAGDLTLHQPLKPKVDVEALLKTASFHFDASDLASITKDDTGRVSEWRSQVGTTKAVQMTASAASPYQSYIDVPLPKYVADYNGSGRPAIDFGPFKSTNDVDFATSGASCLKITDRSPVNHIFIVFANNDERCRGNVIEDSYNRYLVRGSDTSNTDLHYGQTLFSRIGAIVDQGNDRRTARDMAYNGRPVHGFFQFGGRRLMVADIDFRGKDAQPVGANCCERYVGAFARGGATGNHFNHFGGVAISEVIVFWGSYSNDGTKTLTDEQRKAINDYLVRKWLPSEECSEFSLGDLHYTSPGSIKVPANETASVRQVMAARGATIRKDGAGTLLVGNLPKHEEVSVEVKDGGFGFARRETIADTAPAGQPLYHFDADDGDSVIADAEGRLTEWRSRDYATSGKKAWPVAQLNQMTTSGGQSIAPAKPTVVEHDDNVDGRRGIDLGAYRDLADIQKSGYGTGAALQFDTLKTSGRHNGVREVFVLARKTHGSSRSLIGTTTSWQNVYNYGNHATWCHCDVLGGFWACNGVPYDSQTAMDTVLGDASLKPALISVAWGSAQPIDAIGLDRWAPGSLGGYCVYEFLAYDRILTAKERLETEAYLMRKWLGKTHPGMIAPEVREVRFAEGKPAKLVAESDAVVGRVRMPVGVLEKDGAGRLATTVDAAELTGGLKVQSGTLELGEVNLANAFKKAVFHVDASDAATIVTNAVGEVTRWNDVRGADVFWAENWSDWPGAKPTVAKADCNGRDTVDFGDYHFANGDGIGWSKQEAKDVCAAVTDGSGLKWSQRVQLVEGYEIFKLNGGTSKPPIVGSTVECNFHPDYTYIVNRNGNNAHYDIKYNALMMVDDIAYDPMGDAEAKWATYNPRDSYRMYGFAITNKTVAAYPVGGAFAYERHQSAGGLRLAEGLYFTQALTSAERQSVINYLRHKWQVGVTGNVLAPATVEVSKGASLSMGNLSLAARSYSFELGSDGVVGNPLTVGDELILGDGTTIALHAPDGFLLPAGAAEATFRLITANSVQYGANLVFDVDEALTRNYDVSLNRNPDSVGVTFRRRGLTLLFR